MTDTPDTSREAVESICAIGLTEIARTVGMRITPDDVSEVVLAAQTLRALLARAENAEAERDEAARRRDAWRAKAEGFDAVRRALREKVGEPWPPSMSRILWAGIAADEKARADALQAEVDRLRAALESVDEGLNFVHWYRAPET